MSRFDHELEEVSDPCAIIEHMLPEALFRPLELSDAVAATRRAYGARGVVDLLVAALTDRRVRSDTDIDRYLGLLKSACRQTRRYHEAIPVIRRIAVLNPARRHEVAAELALVHGHLHEPEAGTALLESAYRQQRRLSPARRCARFSEIAEIAAIVLRQPLLAREIAALAQPAKLAQPPALVADRYLVASLGLAGAATAVPGSGVPPAAEQQLELDLAPAPAELLQRVVPPPRRQRHLALVPAPAA